MRISDWSSDVCSSDLAVIDRARAADGIGVECVAVVQEHQIEIRTVAEFDAAELAVGDDREAGAFAVAPQRLAVQRTHLVPGARQRRIDQRLGRDRSEEHTSELQSLMRISYAVFCLKTKHKNYNLKYTPIIEQPRQT